MKETETETKEKEEVEAQNKTESRDQGQNETMKLKLRIRAECARPPAVPTREVGRRTRPGALGPGSSPPLPANQDD